MTTKVADHLRTHDSNSRGNNREAILGAGYSELNGNPLCPLCGVDIDTTAPFVLIEALGCRHWVSPTTSHMFRCHWHEPELLHTHRREILRVGYDIEFDSLSENKIFKDVLPTV